MRVPPAIRLNLRRKRATAGVDGFAKKNDRVHVLYYHKKEQKGIQRTAWMVPSDLVLFDYACSCDGRGKCSPLLYHFSTTEWNDCFKVARDKKLADAAPPQPAASNAPAGSTITDAAGTVGEKAQVGAPTVSTANASALSMKQLEKWIKRDLPPMGDDHIITKSTKGTYGMTYKMTKAELDDCILTIRQEFRPDILETGPFQARTTTLPLKDLDLAKLRLVEESPSEGYTKNKASFSVTLSALPEKSSPFRAQTKGLGVDKTEATSRERVRVREQAMGLQLESNLRRAAVLCGATDTPQAPVASTVSSAPEKAAAATTDTASPNKSKKMTNADVIELVRAGLSELVVANSIRQAPERDFDLSPQGLVALKKAKVSDSLIVAMQGAPVAQAPPPMPTPTKAPMYDPSLSRTYAAEKTAAAEATTGCTGIEAMGLYKNEIFDRAMGGGITEWIAKIRNNTAVTKIVVFSWRDQYGEEKASQVQIRGGEIASVRVDMTEAKFIAPVRDLQLKTCQ